MDREREKKPIKGTREWAVAEVNCAVGCSYGCRYCYARYDLVERRKLVTEQEWMQCKVDATLVCREQQKFDGQVMFPATHDIVPDNLEACLQVLENLLSIGNRVLVVSKPNLYCVKRICTAFPGYSSQLLFRFTITARDSNILRIWEPFAPLYQERKQCLEYAFNAGFPTSVSVEPMLDCSDTVNMVKELLPFISHSIWLGKMNKIETRVSSDSEEMTQEIARIVAGQRDENILELYAQLKSENKIHWKESVKMVLGLDLLKEAGLDI